jgi:HCOMODA/2-hydroxy-3-carboxy-muconic semialdehyde decarboxylase
MSTRIMSCIAAALAVAGIIATQTSAQQRGRGAAAPAARQIIDDLVLGNRILAHEGILDGLGHISVRSEQNPERFYLSRDLAPALVTAADLVEYDLDAKSMETPVRQGYQERFIHALIYKARPDVMSVVHAHTPSVLPFTDSSVTLRPMYHMASFLLPAVPMYEIRRVDGAFGMLVNSIETGSALATTLGDKSVALLRGHGAVIVGPNIPEAVSRAIFLDVNARAQSQALALGGTVTYLTQEDVAGPPAPAPAGRGRGAAAPAPAPAPPPATPVVTTYPRSWPYWKERAMGK